MRPLAADGSGRTRPLQMEGGGIHSAQAASAGQRCGAGACSKTIERRGSSVDSADVVIEQSDVTASHLERRGTVSEDSLEREDVAAVR